MYEVPFDKKSIEQDRYEFKIGAKVYKIKRAKYISGDEALVIAERQDMEAMFDLFGKRGTPTGDIVREIPLQMFNDLLDDWAKADGINLGEFLAS